MLPTRGGGQVPHLTHTLKQATALQFPQRPMGVLPSGAGLWTSLNVHSQEAPWGPLGVCRPPGGSQALTTNPISTQIALRRNGFTDCSLFSTR